ncbi:Uncharacterised protein [Mycobacteroides abscessus]|nr:Uncharacterised protein [Mycobacteroides abscessus]
MNGSRRPFSPSSDVRTGWLSLRFWYFSGSLPWLSPK